MFVNTVMIVQYKKGLVDCVQYFKNPLYCEFQNLKIH